jgi:NAD(P)-dependent dehydrogenase (short-subunit alcohol dehydrogenase family)
MREDRPMDPHDLTSATMLVTGGNTGIGLETVIGLAATGARVVFTSRDLARGERARADARARSGSERIDLLSLDLASFASIRTFARTFLDRYDRLDVLINNAGLAPAGHRWETAEGFEAAFGVNHLGHFLLTDLLLPRLRASAPARIVVVSSGAYRAAPEGLCWDDLQHEREFHSMRVYGESKLANIYFARALSARLVGTGVTVNALNPGYVATELGQVRPADKAVAVAMPAPTTPNPAADKITSTLPPAMSAADGARTSLQLALDPDLAMTTGGYFSEGVPERLSRVASDDAAAARLWALSETLIADA